MFKKEFVVMNQVSRHNTKTGVERDFFKLINNSNFGYDCRNNIDSCFFLPIVDEVEEVCYIRKNQNIFDPVLQDFMCVCLYFSTVKASSVCKMLETCLRVQINDVML